MSNQIQINDENEIAAQAELEAVKVISARIAEQNALVLSAIKTLAEKQVEQGENLAAMFGALVDAIKTIQVNVTPTIEIPTPAVYNTVNVPESNVEVKPQVRLTVPKIKRTKETIARKEGLAHAAVTEYEYE